VIQRIWIAYWLELSKAIRARGTYVGPALVAATALCAPLLYRFARDGESDYTFIASATPLALNVVGFVLTVIFCAGLVSSELSSGTLRMILVRPIRRTEILLAKFMLGMTYTLSLTAITAILSWTLAHVLGELLGIGMGGEMLYTGRDMASAYALGLVLNLAPQAATVGYGLLISTLCRNTGSAIGVAVGIWVVLDALKYELGFARGWFTTYLDTPWVVFESYCSGLDAAWFPDAGYCLGVCLGTTAVFLSIAAVVLQRRNLHA
jgi:ABC-2 type transport system permease protein